MVLAVETKSLLLGEGADPRGRRDDRGGGRWPATGVERIIHMRTLHLGPEELLVAAKIAVPRDEQRRRRGPAIDEAEARVRAAVPIARVIYLEPDIYRPDTPAERPTDAGRPTP